MAAPNDTPRCVLLVAAHPNDEFSLAVTLVRHVRRGDAVWISWFAHDDRAQVAERRRAESEQAAELMGIPLDHLVLAELPPLALVTQLGPMVQAIRDVVAQVQPDLVYTPAYEGGHPDHDALNFGVWEAAAVEGVECREYPIYRKSRGRHQLFRRLPRFARLLPGSEPDVMWLEPSEVAFKRELWKTYKTQRPLFDWLVKLSGDELRFYSSEQTRPLPLRDYAKPPHERPLLYEEQYEGAPMTFDEFANRVRHYQWTGGIEEPEEI